MNGLFSTTPRKKPGLLVGALPVNHGMVIRFCADQPGVSVVKVDPALSYVKLEELVVAREVAAMGIPT